MFGEGGGNLWAALPTDTDPGYLSPSAFPEPLRHHQWGFPPPQPPQPAAWTDAENRAFEAALAEFEEGRPDRWLRIAERVPGKTPGDVVEQYRRLERDLRDIEAGVISLPCYTDDGASQATTDCGGGGGGEQRQISFGGARAKPEERKRGVPWTTGEHQRFLDGLERFGKGDWRSISRHSVVTRTPTQVASHAQKYFLRQSAAEGKKDRRRSSIHDVTRPS